MELAQDWRLYQKLTRSRKDRSARIGADVAKAETKTGPLAVVVSSGGNPRIVAVLSGTRNEEEWIGKSLEEFKIHQGQSTPACVLTEAELRVAVAGAAGAGGLFEQRRHLRSQLESAALKLKGNPALPVREALRGGRTGHFLMEALSGWWKKVLPDHYALWIRIQDESSAVTQAAGVRAAPQDALLFFKKGQIVGCGAPDLTSLGTERIWKEEAVLRHLSEKYLCPIQGLKVYAQDWEAWMNAERPWKAVRDSMGEGRVVFAPERSGLKNLVRLRAWTGA